MIDVRDAVRGGELKPNRKLGQCFLTDKNIAARIVEAAGLAPGDHVIEVGPGVCALTGLICERAGTVTAVEIDRRLTGVIERSMSGYGNFSLINADILKVALSSLLPPDMPRQTGALPPLGALSPTGGALQPGASSPPETHIPSIKLISNLPYFISTPVMTRLFEEFSFVGKAVLMMQKEVSDRMLAMPSAPNYCMLTVFANYYGTCRRLFTVPPHCFIPQPGVESAVMLFEARIPGANTAIGVSDEIRASSRSMFFKTVRAAFASRRKTLANGLIHAGLVTGRRQAQEILARANIGADARGESLGVREYINLSRELAMASYEAKKVFVY